MQFYIASRAQKSKTTVIEKNVKNLMKFYLSKTFLIVYAMDQILIHKMGKISGIDNVQYERSKNGKVKAGFQNAVDLVLKINYQFLKEYKCKAIKRVYVLKSSSSDFKSLGVPTILDRTIQKIFQLVINPAIDVFADPNSYGFRKYRSCHNAIGSIVRTNKLY